jgi:hypothetical protein
MTYRRSTGVPLTPPRPRRTPWGEEIPGLDPHLPTDIEQLERLILDACGRLEIRRGRRELRKIRRNLGEVHDVVEALRLVVADGEGDDGDLVHTIKRLKDQLSALAVIAPEVSSPAETVPALIPRTRTGCSACQGYPCVCSQATRNRF